MPLKVLLVDDQPDSIYLLTMLLRMEGFDARGVTDGAEALRLAESWHPHVACLDLGMPRMSGYEVATRLRQIEGMEAATIVAISGFAAEPHLLEPAGIDDHMLKPVRIEDLRTKLSRMPRGGAESN